MKDTRSFFEKLTGAVKLEDTMQEHGTPASFSSRIQPTNTARRTVTPNLPENTDEPEDHANWIEEEPEEGQLTVDVYQSNNDIVVKCMVAGVKPEDLDITITRDMVTVKGRRETEKNIREENYFHQELYWGSFSRTIMLPAEVDVEEAEAIEKHGLLIIKLPKIDKHRQARLKVKGN